MSDNGFAINHPNKDPYTFIVAEDFFRQENFVTPYSATLEKGPDPTLKNDGNAENITRTGAMFRLDDTSVHSPTYFLIQFVRPQVFRVRYDPKVKNSDSNKYNDWNTRTLITRTLTELVKTLDEYEGIFWKVKLDEVVASEVPTGEEAAKPPTPENATHYRLRSVIYKDETSCAKDENGTIEVCVLVQKKKFQITAIQAVRPTEAESARRTDLAEGYYFKAAQKQYKVIWETVENPLKYRHFMETTASTLTVKKPELAKYVGFGEQGGRGLLKTSTFMNYFNYDNMRYQGVYGQGPLDEREPLYHSEPFWIEFNTNQHYKSKVATFIDNFSQICIDFGATNKVRIETGTRFGAMQYYVIAGNDIPDVIRLYTSIIGRPNLKPRYILGYHQACYGYDSKDRVLKVAKRYEQTAFPIDGMHIDVDLQHNYRTFTMDEGRFPDVKDMFTTLRNQGMRCSTNITPIISAAAGLEESHSYKQLNEGVEKKYFVMDKRKTNGFWDGERGGLQTWDISASDVRYVKYEGGRQLVNPKDRPPFQPWDDYSFEGCYNNKNVPFHGGVWYGNEYGTPGYYPNLNNPEVRKWWGEQYKALFDAGLEFVWQDMTTPSMAVQYGDMKSFPFRLLLDCDPRRGEGLAVLPAIEVWHLYSYNLHKATYHGLNSLESRRNKRNFIIGRGSFAGMYRYAGLWTGDNASTWDHFRISVSQVLAAGLSGVTITGADVGGFETSHDGQLWADPELIIRWFCAYSMLPWFRCHYKGKPGDKWFQEPWAYEDHWNNNATTHKPPVEEDYLYLSVAKICKYFVRLRYTLLQLLYDTMFDNLFTGLPIARALVVSDPLDEALFTERQDFLSNEYVVGHDLLVAPIMEPQTDEHGHTEDWDDHEGHHKAYRLHGGRSVYLPQPNSWYAFNLRVKFHPITNPGAPLLKSYEGGSTMWWDGNIDHTTKGDNVDDPAQIPFVTPMFVREGAIIPQIYWRTHVPRKDEEDFNPITLHIYPGGKSSEYKMYLDDGESRDSAPKESLSESVKADQYNKRRRRAPARDTKHAHHDVKVEGLDVQAADKNRQITISQEWHHLPRGRRTVTLSTGTIGKYPWQDVKKRIGESLYVVLWHANDVDINTVDVKVTTEVKAEVEPAVKVKVNDACKTVADTLVSNSRATVVPVPVEILELGEGNVQVVVDCRWDFAMVN